MIKRHGESVENQSPTEKASYGGRGGRGRGGTVRGNEIHINPLC